jgi:hypothetical protein
MMDYDTIARTQRYGLFSQDELHPEHIVLFFNDNTYQRGITLNVASPASTMVYEYGVKNPQKLWISMGLP